MHRSVALVACVIAFTQTALAQSLSDDELARLFDAQRDAFRAAQSSGLGKTRGLTLVTVDPATASTENSVTTLAPIAPAEAATTATATTAAGTTGTMTAGTMTGDATTTTTAATASKATAATSTGTTVIAAGPRATPVVFGALAPELQINVNVKFDFDSAALRDDQKPLLTQLCTVMRKSDIKLFRIVGHTDASGSDIYNQKLSLLRAEEVRRYMIGDCGIDARRLEAMGVGEGFLANTTDPRAAVNRRVEFQALS